MHKRGNDYFQEENEQLLLTPESGGFRKGKRKRNSGEGEETQDRGGKKAPLVRKVEVKERRNPAKVYVVEKKVSRCKVKEQSLREGRGKSQCVVSGEGGGTARNDASRSTCSHPGDQSCWPGLGSAKKKKGNTQNLCQRTGHDFGKQISQQKPEGKQREKTEKRDALGGKEQSALVQLRQVNPNQNAHSGRGRKALERSRGGAKRKRTDSN